MNTTRILTVAAIALTAAFGSTASFADGTADYTLPVPAVSQNTRAEVVADLHANKAQSLVWSSERGTPRNAGFESQLTRAEVHAEAVLALAAGAPSGRNSDSMGFDAPVYRTGSVSIQMASLSR